MNIKKISGITVLTFSTALLACSGGGSSNAVNTVTPTSLPPVSTGAPSYILANAITNLALYQISPSNNTLAYVTSTRDQGFNTATSAMAVSPFGNQLFTSTVSEIDSFSINQSDGNFSPTIKNTLAAGNSLNALAANPLSSTLVSTIINKNLIQSFRYDSEGNMTSVGSAQSTGSQPASLSLGTTGEFAYVANSAANTVSVFPLAESGAVLPHSQTLSSAGTSPQTVLVDPLGRYLYALNSKSNSVTVFTISTDDGSLTYGGTQSTHSAALNMAIDPSGQLAIISNGTLGSVSLYYIDPVTGFLTEVPNSPFSSGNGPGPVAITSNSSIAFVANVTDSTITIFSLDLLAQNLSVLATVPSISGISQFLISSSWQ